jgi:hypothetical protein
MNKGVAVLTFMTKNQAMTAIHQARDVLVDDEPLFAVPYQNEPEWMLDYDKIDDATDEFDRIERNFRVLDDEKALISMRH